MIVKTGCGTDGSLHSTTYFAAYEESDLLFVRQGEVSPGGDGHPPVACIAAAAHDAQMVIVAHAPVTKRVHVI